MPFALHAQTRNAYQRKETKNCVQGALLRQVSFCESEFDCLGRISIFVARQEFCFRNAVDTGRMDTV